LLSLLFVRETLGHAQAEARAHEAESQNSKEADLHKPTMREIFTLTSWKNPALFSCCQAGMVNNLNDGLAWGLFPLLFITAGLPLKAIGVIAAVYPATWGFFQLWTGALSDRRGRKWMISWGMWIQALALIFIALYQGFAVWVAASALLGLGTAMVYPTLLAAMGDVTHPSWRASSVGVYRLWRDSGYAVGALLSGILADLFGIPPAIIAVGALTFLSGLLVAWRMPETLGGQRLNTVPPQ
jgi:MFS family permease